MTVRLGSKENIGAQTRNEIKFQKFKNTVKAIQLEEKYILVLLKINYYKAKLI